MKIEFILIPVAIIIHLFIHIDGIGPEDPVMKWSILATVDFTGALTCFVAAFLRFGGIQRQLGRFQSSNFIWCLFFLSVGLTDLLAEWTLKTSGPLALRWSFVRAMAHAILLLFVVGSAVFLEVYKYEPWVCALLAGIVIMIIVPLYYGYILDKGA
jgi:hypothetical protein